MSKQLVHDTSDAEFDNVRELEAELFAEDRPHVHESQLKLPFEAANLLSHAMNEQRIHKPLAELKKGHDETYNHTLRVTKNALALAWINKDLEGLTSEDIQILVEAALVHDVGKLRVDQDILDSPLRLDEDQSEKMSFHVAHGVEQARGNFNGDRRVLALVELHHQMQKNPALDDKTAAHVVGRLNLSHDDHRKFEFMHQILEAADKYDALISDRSYKVGLPLEKVESMMMNDFTQHDGNLKLVRQIIDLNPPGYINETSSE